MDITLKSNIRSKVGKPRILILGVNPFEDVPGYQLLGLLKSTFGDDLIAADDSEHATRILQHAGFVVERIPHPRDGIDSYLTAIQSICEKSEVELIIPATDVHLMALAGRFSESSFLQKICPQIGFIAESRLVSKWAIQDWLSQTTQVPERWRFNEDEDLIQWENAHQYPVMVKGIRKGGIKCEDRSTVFVARRTLLKNPANHAPRDGVYLEAVIEGEEHSFMVVLDDRQRSLACISLRKLATTQMGTTLAAEVEPMPSKLVILAEWIVSAVRGPAIVEVESRVDTDGRFWVFEANLRFPSWVGALGQCGTTVVASFINSVLGQKYFPHQTLIAPAPGSIIYRLPQSGILPLAQNFAARPMPSPTRPLFRAMNAGPKRDLLWSGAPHQFHAK